MRNECGIIRDLLPIYIEGMASVDSQEFVEEHLSRCEACRAEAGAMRSRNLPGPEAVAPLAGMQRRLRAMRLRVAAVTASLVLALAVALVAQLTRPIYLNCGDAIASVGESAGQIVLNFTDQVARFSFDAVFDPEAQAMSYSVSAWTSAWDRLFPEAGTQQLTLRLDSHPAAVYYSANNGEADVLLHTQDYVPEGGRITLPRLALAYYLIGAAGLMLALILLRMVFCRLAGAKRMLDMLWPMPAAYLLSHFTVMGANTLSYSMTRDFVMILLTSLLFYCALLSLRSLVRIYLQKRQDLAQ